MKEFFTQILKWKNKGESLVNSYNNTLICKVNKEIKNDYLHVLYYPLNENDIKKFNNEYNLNENKGLNDYKNLLKTHNGALLYSGAIVFFGFAEKNTLTDYFIDPPSLIKLNESNRFVKDNPIYIYIGNILHRDLDNINVYLNKKTGYILMMHKHEIFKEFSSLNSFLVHINEYYEPFYSHHGRHINFNDRTKNVYENIQLY